MQFTTYSCMILGILMSKSVQIAILETQVERLVEKQKELTERVRSNEKVVAAVTLLGTVALAVIGAGYFTPKAEACSPRLDGEPTYCGPQDGVLERPVAVSIPEEEDIPEYYNTKVTLYDTRVAHMGHDFPTWPTAGEMIQTIRDHESQKNRISIEDSIGNALDELEWSEEE